VILNLKLINRCRVYVINQKFRVRIRHLCIQLKLGSDLVRKQSVKNLICLSKGVSDDEIMLADLA
jgi:hypothetical protein